MEPTDGPGRVTSSGPLPQGRHGNYQTGPTVSTTGLPLPLLPSQHLPAHCHLHRSQASAPLFLGRGAYQLYIYTALKTAFRWRTIDRFSWYACFLSFKTYFCRTPQKLGVFDFDCWCNHQPDPSVCAGYSTRQRVSWSQTIPRSSP